MEGSTVLLKCSPTFGWMEWFGPAHTQISVEIPVVDMLGHRRMWKVTKYSQGKFIMHTLPHSNRLQVIRRMVTDDFDLQIINASILDEGLYFCEKTYRFSHAVWYILKMINAYRIRYKYYPEGSTVLLKCLLDMEWFGPAHFKSIYQSPVIAMHKHRSMSTVKRYTEEKSVSPSLPHHNRLKVIRRQQTGDYGLQISNASVLDEGLYFCEDSEILAVPDYYILQMINRTTVASMHDMIEEINEGETKKLCCYLASNPTLTSLKWLKGNKTVLVTQNVNETCYTIFRVARYDQDNYTCIAENVIGSGSVTVVLNVKYKPDVSTKQSSIETINEGEMKKLCCCIESYETPILTRWLNGSRELLLAYNVTDICYTINNVSRYDQGIYTCIAENIVGIGSITTVLQVKYKPLVSSMQDLVAEMNEGERKKLCCYVDSNPAPTTTKWLDGIQEILVTHNVNKTCYTFKRVNRYDQGNYTCIAENIIGIGSVIIVLKVNYKPEVSIIRDLAEDIHEGGTKKLCCYVDSNPSPASTRWLNGSQEILVTHNVTKNCYTIKNVSRYDQGNYTCLAENIIGNGSITTVLRVKYKPLVSIMHDWIEEMNEGETKKLCCYVDSNPTPTSTRWLNGSQEISVTHYVTETCCTIANVSQYDSENYTCIAENIIGIGSLTTVLKVKYKPVVSRKHDLIEEIHEGETKKLCCYVDSNTAITSTRWLNGSQEIFVTHNVTETCYTIKNVSRYDQGIYTCTAHNTIGSGSITTVLQVKCEILSTINLETPRGNDDESGHYMEIYVIDENIVTPWHENSSSIISAVEREVVGNRDIAQAPARHLSTTSDDDRNASEYLDDGYEHPYNTLLPNNRAEDEHVYLSPKKTLNNANTAPFENASCGCSFEITEQDSLPDESQTQCCATVDEKNDESEL
ncbi:unnamed protein product [Mytilus coruscus]|uniref:Ig-like domain-containing protein n=1 Tax=Mytilus coruscus TaxID=42192 RepID=A0A6J8B5J2_MYTCO|nr:unnamed protein product [Mytilus coruscus]